MTWSKYHRNCVITGPLDGYCLVCEDHMKNEDDYSVHLEKPIHKKKLEATPYFEKHKDEYIRKVKRGYYCEFCNLLFFTAAKVGLHVVEAQHNSNKRDRLLRRVDNNIVAFHNVLIGDKAWNGFVEDTCVICNTEFDNENIHKTEQNHILNLIQKNVEYGDEELVYRKIDESSYQCLTCNLVMALDTLTIHFKDTQHKDKLVRSPKAGGAVSVKEENNPIKEEKKPAVSSVKEPSNITLPHSEVNVKKTATVENVKEPPKTKPTVKDNVKPNEPAKKKNNIADDSEKKAKLPRDSIKNAVEMDKYICTVLGAKNYVTPCHEGKCMCLLCDWSMDSAAVSAHVSGRHHLTMLTMHRDRLQKMSQPAEVPETNTKPKNEIKEDKIADAPKDNDKSKLLDSLPELQKNDININFEVGVASCKKCMKSFNLDYEIIQNHVEEHKKKVTKNETKPNPFQTVNQVKPKENGNTSLYTKPVFMKKDDNSSKSSSRASSVARDDEQVVNFAKKNNLVYSNGKVNCEVCEVKLQPSVKFMQQHLDGAPHKRKVKVALPTPAPKAPAKPAPKALPTIAKQVVPVALKSPNLFKVPMNEFIKSLISVENFIMNDVIINEKYNINFLSFLMITTEGAVKCEPCDLVMDIDEVDQHKCSRSHLVKMTETDVIMSLDNELIREPRPGVFHCGFCNVVEVGWDSLVEHFERMSHRESRNSAEWRLTKHTSEIMRHRWENMQRNLMSFMMGRFGRRDSSDDEW